jgi:hypothetical protein
MRRLSALASLLPMLAFGAARAEAQSAAAATTAPVVSARSACVLRAFGAAGYRVRAHPDDPSRRTLVRTLIGIDRRTGLLSPDDTRTETVEMQLGGPSGAAITRVSMLRPDRPGSAFTSREVQRADAQARELLRAVEPRCAGVPSGT